MTATFGPGGLWEEFVVVGGRDAALLADANDTLRGAELDAAPMAGLGHVAFRLGLSCLGIGAEPIGKLALAIERAFDRIGAMDRSARVTLADATATLHAAFVQLANPDKSGARVEDLPLAERTASLDAAVAVTASSAAAPAAAPPPSPEPRQPPPEGPAQAAPAMAAPAPGGAAFVWTPAVDDDMLELFFDE
ncbi:MAG: hypothetical protein H6Q90_6359, partial [Deltaproteobacteria bacterium]|nr:hypothetical protein [Deltaproteobacteria bacterium]